MIVFIGAEQKAGRAALAGIVYRRLHQAGAGARAVEAGEDVDAFEFHIAGLERVAAEGTVLGLFDTHRYDETEVVLGPGDSCLLFTDGVLEAPGFTDQFGEDRLHEVLVAASRVDVSSVVEGLAMRLAEHVGDRAHDDIAILGLQNTPDRP